MLTKVVEPGPDLVLFGTAPGGTSEAPISAVLWHNLVNTFPVSVKIIVGTEAIQSFRTVEYVTLERLFMTQ